MEGATFFRYLILARNLNSGFPPSPSQVRNVSSALHWEDLNNAMMGTENDDQPNHMVRPGPQGSNDDDKEEEGRKNAMTQKKESPQPSASLKSDVPDKVDHSSTTSLEKNKRVAPVNIDAENSASSSLLLPDSKRSRSECLPQEENEEVLDLAETMGFKPGDRLEVLWQVGEDNSDHDETNDDKNVLTHWWGATLLEHDGRTEDSVAIRVLDYDPFPEGGYPDRSLEDVVFINKDAIVDFETQGELTFRREGEEQPDIYLGQSQIEEVVNATLMNAFHKNSAAWNKLDRAQQARIADIIATKKEKLLNLLLNHEGCVVTSADMKSILARAMTET